MDITIYSTDYKSMKGAITTSDVARLNLNLEHEKLTMFMTEENLIELEAVVKSLIAELDTINLKKEDYADYFEEFDKVEDFKFKSDVELLELAETAYNMDIDAEDIIEIYEIWKSNERKYLSFSSFLINANIYKNWSELLEDLYDPTEYNYKETDEIDKIKDCEDFIVLQSDKILRLN